MCSVPIYDDDDEVDAAASSSSSAQPQHHPAAAAAYDVNDTAEVATLITVQVRRLHDAGANPADLITCIALQRYGLLRVGCAAHLPPDVPVLTV